MGLPVTGHAIDQITLLGDIGATNARFALLTAGVLGPVKWIEVARYSKFAHAIEDFLQSQFFQSPVSSAVLAVAGPVEGQRSHFTNSTWLVGDGARRIVIASEGGHGTFPAASAHEDAILVHLRNRFGHVSAERLLSGP